MEKSGGKQIDQKPASKAPILRDGNKAYDVERPFFEDESIKKTLQEMREMLLRKVSSDDDELMIEGLPKLGYINDDGVAHDEQETIILASYPRSGNTLLRAYIEKIMGFVTGSDCDIEKKLNKELMHMGL